MRTPEFLMQRYGCLLPSYAVKPENWKQYGIRTLDPANQKYQNTEGSRPLFKRGEDGSWHFDPEEMTDSDGEAGATSTKSPSRYQAGFDLKREENFEDQQDLLCSVSNLLAEAGCHEMQIAEGLEYDWQVPPRDKYLKKGILEGTSAMEASDTIRAPLPRIRRINSFVVHNKCDSCSDSDTEPGSSVYRKVANVIKSNKDERLVCTLRGD